jgi:hypothetical protein
MCEIEHADEGFFTISVGSQVAFWKFIKAHISLSLSLTFNISVQYQSSSIIAM